MEILPLDMVPAPIPDLPPLPESAPAEPEEEERPPRDTATGTVVDEYA